MGGRMGIVDVIVPVYKGFDEVRRCLESLLECAQEQPFEIIVIDDASPQAGVFEYLTGLSGRYAQIKLLRNEINLGFVATANRGMALHPDRDVVLLNSDTQVANHWLDRLVRCAYSDEKIATATPFSNNATICSFPKTCQDNALPGGFTVAEIDRIFAELNGGIKIEIPTGIGFCMYIKRACLDEVGLFDTKAFGKGYGEENDFCMRLLRQGWKHVLCADTFVYHAGGVSFGADTNPRIQTALEKINRLYPDYLDLVHEHIAADPARPYRVKAMLELMRRSGKQRILYITHHLSGGTEKHIRELIACKQGQIYALILRPMENQRFVLSFGLEKNDEAFCFSVPEDYEHLKRLCRYLGISRIHFHHTMGIDPHLWGLPKDLAVPFDITLHDYYFINANPTLTDGHTRFCEDPAARDHLCAEHYPIPGAVTAEKWRENQKVLLNAAARIFAPSQYTATLFRGYFPDCEPIVAYHPDWEQDFPYPAVRVRQAANSEPLRIVVLGALSKEKGADLLEACAVMAEKKGYPLEFHLLGYAYRPLDGSVIQHGCYQDSELDQLMEKLDPHLVWFTALWPETYSYTLSAALRAGLPVVAPDIGAFSERLIGRPYTWVLPWQQSVESFADFLVELRHSVFGSSSSDQARDWPSQPDLNSSSFCYIRDYLAPSEANLQNPVDALEQQWLSHFVEQKCRDKDFIELANGITRREKLLRLLLKLRQYRFIALCLRYIPYRIQRLLKRRLSRKPIHEIVQ